MNISFYTAAVGAQQQQERLDVHGNNFANINNYGFRAKIPSFSSLMTGPITGIEEDLPRGVGSRLEDAETNFNGSALRDTGRKLDYAIEGDGFFGLLDPASGELSYTRDGSFTKSQFIENGETKWYLSDGMGRFVLGRNGQPIEVDDEEEELPVGVFDFVNHNGMLNIGENRFVPVEKNGAVGLGTGRVFQGCLELSNADLAYEFSKVVESQRSFSLMLRMVTTSDDIESTVNSLRG